MFLIMVDQRPLGTDEFCRDFTKRIKVFYSRENEKSIWTAVESMKKPEFAKGGNLRALVNYFTSIKNPVK